MRYLLDTHVFFWCVKPGFAVPVAVADTITDRTAELFVSDASAYEVSNKVRLTKFDAARPLAEHWPDYLRSLISSGLPVGTEHALVAGSLDWDHRDPFDRLIAAQAVVDDLTLVTADRHFDAVPDLKLLRW